MSKPINDIEHLGPDLGSHNDEIYGGLLGLSREEMTVLKTEGVI